jgi:hypothetical protein
MKTINALAIRIDGGTQARTELNVDKVNEYAEQMKDGAVFPPIVVFFDGKDHWLSSGFHRYFANKKLDKVSILCDVKDGTVRDAKLYAYSANQHGMPHTQEENRRIIQEMVLDPEWGKWSNVQIAKHIGVSSMTVGRLRKTPSEVTYVKNGKKVKIKTKNLGKKATPPTPPPPPPVDEKLEELTDTIVTLDEENTKLKDIINTKRWDASDIEQEDALDTIKELREKVRILEIEISTLRDSRDMFQHRNAELIRQVKSLQKKK